VVAIAVAVVAAVPLDCQRTRLTPPRQIDTHSEFKPALPRKWVALTSFAKKKIKFIKLHLKVIRNISCACQRKKNGRSFNLIFSAISHKMQLARLALTYLSLIYYFVFDSNLCSF